TVLLWDLAGLPDGAAPPGKLTAKDLEALWAGLDSSDAKEAYRAMLRLLAAPHDAAALVGQHVKPAVGDKVDAERSDKLIADLDSDLYQARERATRGLAGLGKEARPALVKALESNPSVEKKRRVEKLLEALSKIAITPGMVRQTRALEVLERLCTPES